MLKTKEEIENWLNKYEIENFFINEDLTVDVNGDVNLFQKGLKELPFKFGIVKGYFDCSFNKLESLKNCPKEIKGYFKCSYNELTSLENCPEMIEGDFVCSGNKLTNLKYSPKEIKGDFHCNHNKLASLEYCPKKVNGNFYCYNNNLKKELLYLFNSNIKGNIKSNFGNKKNFLNEVRIQKSIKEKKELNKIIIPQENSPLIKKRL